MEGSGTGTLSSAAVHIVEDDIAPTGMIALVEAAGGSVMALALDGRAALDILEQRRPDIALLNVGPAAGSGLAVARRLHELNLPFVVIGTYSDDILSAELRDAPYLSKPCTADQIVGPWSSSCRPAGRRWKSRRAIRFFPVATSAKIYGRSQG